MKNAKAILIAKASLLDGEQTRKKRGGKERVLYGAGGDGGMESGRP